MANFIKQVANNMLGSDIEMLDEVVVIASREGTTRFPLNLGDNGRPFIHFSCEPQTQDDDMHAVFLPIPQGITFGDGASYTTFDVGLIGEFAKVVAKKGDETGFAAAISAAGEVKDMLGAELGAIGPTGASILAARKAGFDNIASGIEFANKQVMNPRTNSAFSGNTIRNYQFDFKMIGKSESEVQMIDTIQKIFRTYVYAEKYNKTSSFMLKYPPTWEIRFVDPDQNELEYIPKIYTCYLTGVNTVINPSSNTFRREDLSPYEIDMSLQFQETKILTRDEFEKLEKYGDRSNEQDEAFNSAINQLDQAGQDAQKIVKKTAENAEAKIISEAKKAAEKATGN